MGVAVGMAAMVSAIMVDAAELAVASTSGVGVAGVCGAQAVSRTASNAKMVISFFILLLHSIFT
jgi:hypothetical protein